MTFVAVLAAAIRPSFVGDFHLMTAQKTCDPILRLVLLSHVQFEGRSLTE